MLKSLNPVIVFMLELVMIASLANYGYQRNTTALNRYFLAFLLPIAAMILWAIFAAPKSSHRLAMPYLALFRAGMFLISAVAVFQIGHKKIALLLVVLAIVTQAISYVAEE